MATRTIAETITDIRQALQEYIEATYHVGNSELVAQRHELLEQEGVLFRAPYIESTPRYTVGRPFADLDVDPKTLHVTFLSASPDPKGVQGLEDGAFGSDELAVVGTDVFLHCPGGYGETKLNNAFLERREPAFSGEAALTPKRT